MTPEGDGYIKGLISSRARPRKTSRWAAWRLIGKLDADITIDLSEKLSRNSPTARRRAGAMVDAGYAKREGDRLICKIVFTKGELTVNGKPQAIPGLGGPPPGRGWTESSPPQE